MNMMAKIVKQKLLYYDGRQEVAYCDFSKLEYVKRSLGNLLDNNWMHNYSYLIVNIQTDEILKSLLKTGFVGNTLSTDKWSNVVYAKSRNKDLIIELFDITTEEENSDYQELIFNLHRRKYLLLYLRAIFSKMLDKMSKSEILVWSEISIDQLEKLSWKIEFVNSIVSNWIKEVLMADAISKNKMSNFDNDVIDFFTANSSCNLELDDGIYDIINYLTSINVREKLLDKCKLDKEEKNFMKHLITMCRNMNRYM